MTAARTAAVRSPGPGERATSPDASAFGGSRACFEAASMSHGELEGDPQASAGRASCEVATLLPELVALARLG